MIKNKVMSGLLVNLVVLVGARIGGVTDGLISTRPVTALRKLPCQDIRARMSGEAGLIE